MKSPYHSESELHEPRSNHQPIRYSIFNRVENISNDQEIAEQILKKRNKSELRVTNNMLIISIIFNMSIFISYVLLFVLNMSPIISYEIPSDGFQMTLGISFFEVFVVGDNCEMKNNDLTVTFKELSEKFDIPCGLFNKFQTAGFYVNYS